MVMNKRPPGGVDRGRGASAGPLFLPTHPQTHLQSLSKKTLRSRRVDAPPTQLSGGP